MNYDMNNQYHDVPMGLVNNLAQNETALLAYFSMTKQQKQDINNMARQVTSKSEMQRLIQNIADKSLF